MHALSFLFICLSHDHSCICFSKCMALPAVMFVQSCICLGPWCFMPANWVKFETASVSSHFLPWAARYNTWLLIKLTPKVLSFLSLLALQTAELQRLTFCVVYAEGQGCCKKPHKEAEEQSTPSAPVLSSGLPSQQQRSKESEERRAGQPWKRSGLFFFAQ